METYNENNLPKFVKEVTISNLESLEETIMSVYSKLITITKAVTTQNYSKPQDPIKVISIVPKTITSANAVKIYLKEYETKIEFSSYLDTIKEIVEELEINVIANSMSFYNPKLLKHYQKAVNTLLIDAKVKDIINFCLTKLNEEVSN